MPLTVEESKPRLCHDERFLNCWIKDTSLVLDTLKEVPRIMVPGSQATTCDEKSGFDHVSLTPNSYTYFGFEWGGFYFCYTTLPFGFKASSYIYHTIGMAATSYLRSLGIPVLQYIDDRFVGEVLRMRSHSNSPRAAKAAIYCACELLTRLGYTLSKKSQLSPSTQVLFLGLICDSVAQSFAIPRTKRVSFADVREAILGARMVNVKTLQRFAGKCISFILAVPAARLYIREVNHAISKAVRNSRAVSLSPQLIAEIQHWRFVDTCVDFLPWRSEKHLQVSLSTDASLYKWGAMLHLPAGPRAFGDYFDTSKTDGLPIHVKEALALLQSLKSVKDQIRNSRVDAYVDNTALLHAWANEGPRDLSLTNVLKDLFQLSVSLNNALKLHYIPSKDNSADKPSRSLSASDGMLAGDLWELVERTFGPHSVDLMALDSNCMRDKQGQLLKHFTPHPTPQSSGVNVFSQTLTCEQNPYVFPPFAMIGPLLRHLMSTKLLCTFVAPEFYPRQFWWPALENHVVDQVKLGKKRCERNFVVPKPIWFSA